jgi:predicted amidophosphoribosyltransferase
VVPLTGPEPAGFGNCAVCAYRETGPAETCYPCARGVVQPIAPHSCEVCNQEISGTDTVCGNRLCQSSMRHFDLSYAIAMKSGALERAIISFKFNGKWGWGVVFARVLNGYLYEHGDLLEDGAIIIPSPSFHGDGFGPHDDHTAFVIQSAAEQDEHGLPYVWEPPVILKTAQTRKLKSLTAYDRRVEGRAIKESLVVPDSSRVAGRAVWVYDDVFTTGTTLDAVAEVLKEAGATAVMGLVLSRQPWA